MSLPTHVRTLETPLGRYRLTATREGVTRIEPADLPAPIGSPGDEVARRHAAHAADALVAYFGGRRSDFDDLVLAACGSAFRARVWDALRAIPFGRTESYGALARRIGRPGGARAVGGASHDNPWAIVVPCHRVVAANGDPTGYAGGIERKRWLLRHEGAEPRGIAARAASRPR